MSMLGSSPDSGVLHTRSQWNVRRSVGLYAVTQCSCEESKPKSQAAPDSSDPVLLAPVKYHRGCVPLDEELLVDNCFDNGDNEAGGRCENVDGPSTQVTLLGIGDGQEVTPNRALVLFVAWEARVHAHVLWNSGYP